jgi:sec-independent protein translocase protein TatA
MFNLGVPELVIILVIILVIFGGSQLPKLARSIGTSAKELRKGLKDDEKEKPKKTAAKSEKAE